MGLTPVFLPYTYIHGPTWDALESCGWPWVPVHLARLHEDAYLWFFEERWRQGDAFMVCEHDVIPGRDQLAQLEDCPAGWCAFNEYDGGPPTLSLARFRPAFIGRWPDIWADLRAAHRISVFQPLWSKLDSWLTDSCGQPCLHESPHVVNMRPMGSLHG